MIFSSLSAQTLWMPEQASTISSEVDGLFYFILHWLYIFLTLVSLVSLYFFWKYKDTKKKGLTSPLDHNNVLELVWTIIPFILLMIVFFRGTETYLKMNIAPYDSMEINVTAQKWFWTFNYNNGIATTNELVVPVNKPVKLIMKSQDVLHSFFVPSFRVKMDVIPNRYMISWFEANKVGEYDIFCAEYCGQSHSGMVGKVKVLSSSDYEKWITGANLVDESTPLIDIGAKIYKKNGCNACHSIDGTRIIGPSFKETWGSIITHTDGSKALVDENYILESITNPMKKIVDGYQPSMPPYKDILKDREVEGLIEYIKSLK